MKNLKKFVLAAAVFATFFNNCEVMAAEKNLSPKEIKVVNSRIEELNEKFEEQKAIQEKILDLLENLRTTKVKGASEENISYNPAALVNPSSRRVSYTQDGANSQDNSTVIFKYAPNQLYKIYCRVGYLTDLSLKKGERINFVGGGDTSAWAVEKATVDGVPHIYIKPTVETSTTNLIITTNKRSYQLILNTSDWYNPMVTWNYGYEEDSEINFREEQNSLSGISGNIENLNFNYKISGKFEEKITVFDDGEKTILKFNSLPKRLPSVFVKNRGKKGLSMVNYKIRNDCYVLDRIADEIELRVSEKEILKIKNNAR
ncbi:MAG: TrbG/VirB9 family P-type conjugative transfer protein [Selenomonadaceae bacterium]|nr:TrbG/VirB9 family P-type conjugative transfer protein [Selenomonadaceae bacterium]